MSDLVERLRAQSLHDMDDPSSLMEGAADRIEAQRDRIAELEGRLIEQRRIHSVRVWALEGALAIVPVAPTPDDIEWAERSILEARIEELEARVKALDIVSSVNADMIRWKDVRIEALEGLLRIAVADYESHIGIECNDQHWTRQAHHALEAKT